MDYFKLQDIFYRSSQADIEEFLDTFDSYAVLFGIDTKFQEDLFLAQIRAEIGVNLRPKRENLNYSCKGLRKIFKYYRKNPKDSNRDGRCNGHRANHKKIANKVYSNRLGNGGYSSGDGFRFSGSGYVQITGRYNFSKISAVISQVLNAKIDLYMLEETIHTPSMALLSALGFWYINKIYNCETVDCATRKINRYTKSYRKRREYYNYISSL